MRQRASRRRPNPPPHPPCLSPCPAPTQILQADEYEREQGTLLQDFFDSTQGKIKTPLVASWASELRRQREERLAADAAAEGGGAST